MVTLLLVVVLMCCCFMLINSVGYLVYLWEVFAFVDCLLTCLLFWLIICCFVGVLLAFDGLR